MPPSRAERGRRRLRGLARLAIPERQVRVPVTVEPCARLDWEQRLIAAVRAAS